MAYQNISGKDRNRFNSLVSHPLQSYEWGEFREKSGVKVIRKGFFQGDKLVSAFQLTIHPIPHTQFTIGYLPKGEMPTREILEELKKIGREEKCIFIQLEPNVRVEKGERRKEKLTLISHLSSFISLRPAARPLFTKYTFVLDLTKSEEELLADMHQKARYNIKVAKKHEVEVVEDESPQAFNEYLKLTEQTTRRQKFFAHTESYHKLMWSTLGNKNPKSEIQNPKQIQNTKYKILNTDELNAHLLTAKYKGKVLTAWILFVFKDILYYPYGASSSEHREAMSSSLMMWEAIRFGKRFGLAKFDMWGALGPDPDKNDPWYGFHSFKEKYGPEHVEFIGSYDLVINPLLYEVYKIADKLRWLYLRIKK